MSEELQNETLSLNTASADITETASTEAIENPKGPDLATETQSESVEEVKAEPTEEEKAAKRQDAFNREYGVRKQAERDRDAALAEVQRMQQVQQPETPTIGELPNEYDYDTTEEFEAAKTAFISNVQNVGRHNQQQETNANYAQQQNVRAQQEQQERYAANAKVYAGNAKKLGISAESLIQAENAIISYGATNGLANAIMETQDPLITQYLAANPQAVESIVNAGEWNGRAIFDDIKAKAQALKPKTSNTPAPTADIQGSGAEPGKHPALEGVIYS